MGFAVLYPKILDFRICFNSHKISCNVVCIASLLSIIALLVKIFRLIYEKTSGTKVDESRRRFLHGVVWVPAISATLYVGLPESRNIEFVEQDIDCSAFLN